MGDADISVSRSDSQVTWPFVNVENTPDSVPKQHQQSGKMLSAWTLLLKGKFK